MNELQRKNFFIKPGYRSRTESAPIEDLIPQIDGLGRQPHVYSLAAHLARKFGCRYIVDIGCGRAQKLTALYPEFEVIGIDFDSDIEFCRQTYQFGQWFNHDLEKPLKEQLSEQLLAEAIIVCSEVIENLVNPLGLLISLKVCLDHAPVAILSTTERDLLRSKEDLGPPANPCHIREWNLEEFKELLECSGLQVAFTGLTCNNSRDLEKNNILAVLHNNRAAAKPVPAPCDFKVMALVTAFNEEDVIASSIGRLIEQGVEVYLIDNGSTDNTVPEASRFLGKGLVGVERFIPDGSTQTFELKKLLSRVEGLSRTLTADWFIHHDVDEIRESPWPGTSLRDALYLADQMGFNAIDHTVVNFRPIDNGFTPGGDFGVYFNHWEFGRKSGHFQQIKAWKNFDQQVGLADSGGHSVNFAGRKIFPYKFLLRHYPIRSQYHGEKKVLNERKDRFSALERKQGWHTQYDHIKEGHRFLVNPQDLAQFDPIGFYRDYLVERISGVGILPTDHENNVVSFSSGSGLFARLKRMLKR